MNIHEGKGKYEVYFLTSPDKQKIVTVCHDSNIIMIVVSLIVKIGIIKMQPLQLYKGLHC